MFFYIYGVMIKPRVRASMIQMGKFCHTLFTDKYNIRPVCNTGLFCTLHTMHKQHICSLCLDVSMGTQDAFCGCTAPHLITNQVFTTLLH